MRRLAVLLLFLLWPMMLAAQPRAWLDRDRIQFGETVTLNVETDARGGREPDFSALDSNFRILGTSSSTQLSIVNGRQSARTLWAVALEPLQEGVIGIPALSVGNELTPPLTLTVLPAANATDAGDADVFLEIDAEPRAPWVQQQVRYVVRLYYAVTLLEGQLEEPQAEGVQVRRLGQDLTYFRTVGQRRYQVTERRYALIPEASGTLEIPPLRFTGRALRGGNYGSPLGGNARVGARGDAVTLEVKPRPSAAPDPWLPARSLRLDDESGALDQVTVGEPLTLTLRLHAQGLAAEQLPELTLPRIDGAEVYPDQEVAQNRDDGEWMHGERVRKFALVPTRPGPLQIPSVGIDWWDVQAGRAARTSTDARTLQVAAAGATAAAASPAVPAASAPASQAPPSSFEITSPTPTPAPARPWQYLSGGLLLLWLLTLVWAWRRRVGAVPRAAGPPPVRKVAAPVDLRHAGTAHELAQALLERLRQDRPTLRSLGEAAALLEPAAQRDAVQALERALYFRRSDTREAAMDAVRQAFARAPQWCPADATAMPAADPLPPLYPRRAPR